MKQPSIYYQVGCSECCALPHATRRHGEVPSRRLKTQVGQYLAQDDWLWEDALGMDSKLEHLQISIRKLREDTMQKIYAKKLSYALGYDKADNIESSFKLARDGEWKSLTCSNIFRVQEKLNRGRKIDEKDVKSLTRAILDDTEKELQILVKECLSSSSNNNSRYEKADNRRDERREYRKEDNARRPYQPKDVRRDQPAKRQAKQFDNGFPTLKVDEVTQIDDIDTHFNIVLKVMKVTKQFRIGNIRKLQFVGGDQTGTSVVVIDYDRLVTSGIVISISNAHIYMFHNSKQIQSSNKNSEVRPETIVMNRINQDFNLSERKGERQRRRPRPREDRPRDRRPQEDREERPRREERPQREERPPREDRPPRQDRPRYAQNSDDRRQPREDRDGRSFYADRNVEERPPRRDREEAKRYEDDTSSRASRNQVPPKPAERIQRDYNRNKKVESSQSEEVEDFDEIKPQAKNSSSSPKKQEVSNATKISKIQPGDEQLTIFAEVFQLEIEGPTPAKGHFLSYIGDETGIVRMQLPKSNLAIKEGAVIKIVNVNVQVDQRDHRITLKLADDGFCDKTNIKLPKVEITNDMSQVEWQSDGEEEQEGGPIIEDL